jgi:hypothetical protein
MERIGPSPSFGDAERFIRMWEYYLAGCEASFRHYGLVAFQIQLVKHITTAPLTRNGNPMQNTKGRSKVS